MPGAPEAVTMTVSGSIARSLGEVDPVGAQELAPARAVGVEERLHRLAHRRPVVDPDLGVGEQLQPLEARPRASASWGQPPRQCWFESER